RHTRCYRDWSSDVCSSDLLRATACNPFCTMVKNGLQAVALNHQLQLGFRLFTVRGQQQFAALPLSGAYATQRQQSQVLLTTLEALGRASCRGGGRVGDRER